MLLSRVCSDPMFFRMTTSTDPRTVALAYIEGCARKDYDAVQLHWPAVRAHAVPGGLGLGKRVTVRLVEADPSRRRVQFAPA